MSKVNRLRLSIGGFRPIAAPTEIGQRHCETRFCVQKIRQKTSPPSGKEEPYCCWWVAAAVFPTNPFVSVPGCIVLRVFSLESENRFLVDVVVGAIAYKQVCLVDRVCARAVSVSVVKQSRFLVESLLAENSQV